MFENDVVRFAIGVLSFFVFLGSVWAMGFNAFGKNPPKKMVGQVSGSIAAFAAIMGAIAFFNPPLWMLEMIAGATIFVVGSLALSAFLWRKRLTIKNWLSAHMGLIWKVIGVMFALAVLGFVGYLTWHGYTNGEPNWVMLLGVGIGAVMVIWVLIWDLRNPGNAYWGVYLAVFSTIQILMPVAWPLASKYGVIGIGVHIALSFLLPFLILELFKIPKPEKN